MGINVYTKEMKDFIAANVEGKTTKELTKKVNARFDINISESAMKAYKSNHKLKCNLKGMQAGLPSKLWPQEIKNYIEENHKHVGPKAMAGQLNKKFGTNYSKNQVKGYYGNHNINSGLTGRFEIGKVNPNKGKKGWCIPGSENTRFKKGNVPENTSPIGTEVITTRQGYIKVKIEQPNKWKFKHVLEWEKVHGLLPDGQRLTFLDGNRQNCKVENLRLITNAEHLIMVREKLRSADPKLTDLGVNIAKLEATKFKRLKEIKANKKIKGVTNND